MTVYNAMRRLNVHSGETVAVQGIGSLGHLAIQFASKMGYRVVALSSSEGKRQLAMDLGAHHYVDGSRQDQGAALRELGGAAMIVCTAPNAKSIAEVMEGSGLQGKLLILTRESFGTLFPACRPHVP